MFDHKTLNDRLNCYHVRFERAAEMIDLEGFSSPGAKTKKGERKMFEF